MLDLSFEELRMLHIALETEIIRREDSASEKAKAKLPAYEALLEKVYTEKHKQREKEQA